MTIKSQYETCFISKNRDLLKSGHVCGSESCPKQRRLLRTSEKELMLFIRIEKFTKPSLKSLDSTNPPSDRLCSNGGNPRPSREVAGQQRSLQSRTCNRRYSGNICSQTKQLKAFLTLLMLMFMSPPSGEHWVTMVCMEERHCSPKTK